MSEEVIGRLKSVMDRYFGGKQKKLAKAMGCSASYVSELLNPDNQKKSPSSKYLANLANYFKNNSELSKEPISLTWLEDGRDDAIVPQPASTDDVESKTELMTWITAPLPTSYIHAALNRATIEGRFDVAHIMLHVLNRRRKQEQEPTSSDVDLAAKALFERIAELVMKILPSESAGPLDAQSIGTEPQQASASVESSSARRLSSTPGPK